MIENLHPIVAEITTMLDDKGCWYETFEHEPVRTSEEAAKTRPGYELHHGAKAIILRVKKSKKDKWFVMIVFPAHHKFNNVKVKTYFDAKDIRFATSEEVNNLTGGVQPGGVSPFGNLFDLPVYVTPELFDNERIVFNAGDKRFSLAMNSADYRRLVEPVEFSFL
jgi:Ala-tRNA(Pro) deacylase